jgi:hypothetical protein
MNDMKTQTCSPFRNQDQAQSPVSAAQNKGQSSSGHRQVEGLHWRDHIYLVPTSDVDGRRRWETIILMLAQKLLDSDIKDALITFKLIQK